MHIHPLQKDCCIIPFQLHVSRKIKDILWGVGVDLRNVRRSCMCMYREGVVPSVVSVCVPLSLFIDLTFFRSGIYHYDESSGQCWPAIRTIDILLATGNTASNPTDDLRN